MISHQSAEPPVLQQDLGEWIPRVTSATTLQVVYHSICVCYFHYSDVIMSAMASEITGVSMVCSTVCSGVDHRKHPSSVSVAIVREFTGDLWTPPQRASNSENASILILITSSCFTREWVLQGTKNKICRIRCMELWWITWTVSSEKTGWVCL